MLCVHAACDCVIRCVCVCTDACTCVLSVCVCMTACAWMCPVSPDQGLSPSRQVSLGSPLSDGSAPAAGPLLLCSLQQVRPSPTQISPILKAELQVCLLQEALPVLTWAPPGTTPGLWLPLTLGTVSLSKETGAPTPPSHTPLSEGCPAGG